MKKTNVRVCDLVNSKFYGIKSSKLKLPEFLKKWAFEKSTYVIMLTI